MTVFVTGGTGFVGPRVVAALRARDLPVRALARRPDKESPLSSLGVELVEGDVTKPETLATAMAGADVVVHLVSIIQGKPKEFERIMCEGTRNVVAAAREAGVKRFLLMSALGLTEETARTIPYFRCKQQMEEAVSASGIDHVIFRPSFIFGPGGGALKTFRRLAKAPVNVIVGPGTPRVQPIWIDDVAQHFALAVDRPEATGRTFDLGGPEVVTWNELFARIRRAVGARRPTLHLPYSVMRLNARLIQLLPGPTPITRDQVNMIAAGDNVVSDHDAAREVFSDVELVALDEQLRRSS
jgi:NADH dehydrogenase